MASARAVRFVAETLVIVLLGFIGAACLVRYSPGFEMDARQADVRLSEESIRTLREERLRDAALIPFVVRYARGVLRGDLGVSLSTNRPVAELVAERAPVTLRLVLAGTVLAAVAGLGSAVGKRLLRPAAVFTGGSAALLLAMPAGVVALLAVFAGVPPELALAAVVAPGVYVYCDRLIAQQENALSTLAAHGLGIARLRIFLVHILPVLAAELGGLLGLAFVTAASACIPIEAICSQPGLGQLAWRAALDRDMPVVAIVSVLMVLATRVSAAAAGAFRPAPEGARV
jgi:peptide/nickel transport system permease protein